ncbi:S49 family peptidase [Aquimarina aggregata]|uniref:S49 family peptidase n=1 Tax=Aquimarina aggregata TaxID=1642818 RepID=UPI0024933BAC|nr:S49 family peptidase [Aquimarina aggregata]
MDNNVNNLHSLLGGKWMITDDFASSLTPFLVNILTRGEISFSNDLQNGSTICFMDIGGNISSDVSDTQEKRIAILNIKGPILKYSQSCGPMGTKDMMHQMEQWKINDSIIGVLLDFDTGGGQLAGTPKFSEYVYNYNKEKPVLAYTDGTIASAGLYIAASCKEIIADKHAMAIGSLGTMHKSINTDGVIEKLGGQVLEVYAEKSTKKNNASREAKKGNLDPLIKDELNPLNEKFHSEVLMYRPSIKPEALDGQHTYDIKKAKELGLIDAIGDKQYAIDRLFELAKQNNQNQNNQDMSGENKNYGRIGAAIGQDELKLSSKILSGKKGVFLTDSQLELLEQKLEGHDTALSAAVKATEEKTKEVTTLEATATTIETSVNNALTEAGLEAGADISASITQLGAKVKEYGAQPGAKPTTVISNADRNFEDKNAVVDMSDAHNQLYKNL